MLSYQEICKYKGICWYSDRKSSSKDVRTDTDMWLSIWRRPRFSTWILTNNTEFTRPLVVMGWRRSSETVRIEIDNKEKIRTRSGTTKSEIIRQRSSLTTSEVMTKRSGNRNTSWKCYSDVSRKRDAHVILRCSCAGFPSSRVVLQESTRSARGSLSIESPYDKIQKSGWHKTFSRSESWSRRS